MWQHFGVAELGPLKECVVVNTELEFEEPHSHTTVTSSEFVLQAKLSIDGFRALGSIYCFGKTTFKQSSKRIRNNNTYGTVPLDTLVMKNIWWS